MKIAIITDSGSGWSKQEANDKGIFYLPLQIIDEEKVYLDGIDITKEQIFEMIHMGKMLKTSMPPIGMVEGMFKQLKQDGYDHVISIPLTKGISGTAEMIHMNAKNFDMDITTIECFTTCNIEQYLALSAKRLVDEGVELDEIVKRLNTAVAHSGSLVIPDDLDYLKRGGRLTPLAAALAGMLKIKPILQINESTEGRIDTFAKVRTMSKAMKETVDAVKAVGVDEDYVLILFHADAPEIAQEYKDLYFGAFPNNETIFDLIGPVISAHTGTGCVGIQYIKKV